MSSKKAYKLSGWAIFEAFSDYGVKFDSVIDVDYVCRMLEIGESVKLHGLKFKLYINAEHFCVYDCR